MKIIIKSASICDPKSRWNGKKEDVLVENGTIKKIGGRMPAKIKTIDAKGMWLTPGWVDMWASFWDPGIEYKEDLASGREAAMKGGFTAVAVLPNTQPVIQTKNELKYILEQNRDHLTQVFPIAAITQNTEGGKLTEMIDLYEHGAVAFSDGLKSVESGGTLVKALRYLSKFNGLLIQRPEDISLCSPGHMNEGQASTSMGVPGIPNISEDICIQRDLELLDYAGGRLHFANISTADSVSLIRKAKKSGNLSCSMASYQTAFVDDDLESFDTNLKVNPPFRSKRDHGSLLKGLADGTIDVINSNHVPQDEESKNLEFDLADFGIPSLQTVAADLVRLSNDVAMELLLPKVSTNPRALLGLPDASIEEGMRAELTLFDPRRKWVFDENNNHSKSEYTPFLGRELTGRCILVVNGKKSYINE